MNLEHMISIDDPYLSDYIDVQKALNEKQIFPRRYFYPSLDTLSYIEPKQYSPISRDISNRILALPMYPELMEDEQSIIIDTVKSVISMINVMKK